MSLSPAPAEHPSSPSSSSHDLHLETSPMRRRGHLPSLSSSTRGDILPKTGTGLPFSIPVPQHLYGESVEGPASSRLFSYTVPRTFATHASLTKSSPSPRTLSRGGSSGRSGRNSHRNHRRRLLENSGPSGGGASSSSGATSSGGRSGSLVGSNGLSSSPYVSVSMLVSEYRLAQSQRLANPHLLLNRVVYDSIEASPMHQGSQSPAVLTRRMATTSSTTAGYCFEHEETTPGSAVSGSSMSATLSRARACIATGTSTNSRPYYVPLSLNDTTLVFESRFENGNLRRAIQVYEFEYDLILKFDINTRGYTQWYYFRVSNVPRGRTVRFNVINLLKSQSLYNEGMKPLIYSVVKSAREKVGWFRGGTDIAYYRNHIKRSHRGFFYTLSFKYTFEEEGDHFFAYCFPYSFTQCKADLNELERDPVRRRFIRRRTLCQSLAGNNVDVLTITSFSGDPRDLQRRKGVVLSARVHPGESNSSWMMKGAIDFLTGPSIDAQILRDNFVFRVVPMLNPDGVINGNYRTSLAGVDLNRQWKTPSKKLHPTIWHIKNMIRAFSEQREVILFVDLHGHSRKKNIFVYGCSPNVRDRNEKLRTRVFPRILWKISKAFSFSDCAFNLSRKKEGSARIVGFKDLRIGNSFTMEASFCGASFGRYAGQHFSTAHLEEMGSFLCEAILDYRDPDQSMVTQVVRELDLLYPSIDNLTDDEEDDDSVGSDSQEDEPRKNKGRKKKKTKKKKRKPKRARTRKRTPVSRVRKAAKSSARTSGSDSESSQKRARRRKTGTSSPSSRRKPPKSHRLSIGAFESYRTFRNRLFGRSHARPETSRLFGRSTVYDILSLKYETVIGLSDRDFVRGGVGPGAGAGSGSASASRHGSSVPTTSGTGSKKVISRTSRKSSSVRPRPTTGRSSTHHRSKRSRVSRSSAGAAVGSGSKSKKAVPRAIHRRKSTRPTPSSDPPSSSSDTGGGGGRSRKKSQVRRFRARMTGPRSVSTSDLLKKRSSAAPRGRDRLVNSSEGVRRKKKRVRKSGKKSVATKTVRQKRRRKKKS